ncbi:MAG: ABC transporter substrate-binding protein [Gammaproteobacteria bacterium]|nr:ABC transporter substrate-binding protein [Gammaproteobacteria bacterium]MCY4270897.1 ABC transporter substrate-binding protein [Gammaproteobacteria bacterium]MCY4296128.1 ABC transporter substrate-binding protein [Gammaproteobacteria bacterium]
MSGFNRRKFLYSGLLGGLASPWLGPRLALAQPMADGESYEGVSDEEIVLGTSAAFSGPSQGLGIELYRGAQAYFTQVNAEGGINGRRIVLKLYDDGYQPVPSVQNTMELLLRDRVFALFGYVGTPTVTRVLPILKKFQQENVYIFFPFTGAQPQREPPYGEFAFNLRASYLEETAGLVENFLSIGRRRIAVFYQADAYGRSGWAGVRAALGAYGERIVAEATYTRGAAFTSSMREQVAILRNGNPDAVICIGAYGACAAFLRDAVDGGIEAPIANLSFVGSENLLQLIIESVGESAPYTRWLVNSQVVPSYEDDSIPIVREYSALMRQNNPQVPEALRQPGYAPFERSFTSLEGFANAKMMAEILTRLGDSPNRARLEEAIFTVRDFDLGIGELISFSPERRQGMRRLYYTVVEQDRFVPLEDWQARFG